MNYTNSIINNNNLSYPVSYKFTVTSNDYMIGYVYRYFVKKINSNFVHEVSEENYNNIASGLFCKTSLKWTLVGPKNNTYQNAKLFEYGVSEKNSKSVEAASKYMPELKQTITDYSLFCKPSAS